MLRSMAPTKLTFVREMVADGDCLLDLNSLFSKHLQLVFDFLDPIVQILNHRRVLGVVLETLHLQTRCDQRCFFFVQTNLFFFHHSHTLVINLNLSENKVKSKKKEFNAHTMKQVCVGEKLTSL